MKALASVAKNGRATLNGCAGALSTASARNISFDRKPFSSGTPAIAAAATIASVPV